MGSFPLQLGERSDGISLEFLSTTTYHICYLTCWGKHSDRSWFENWCLHIAVAAVDYIGITTLEFTFQKSSSSRGINVTFPVAAKSKTRFFLL